MSDTEARKQAFLQRFKEKREQSEKDSLSTGSTPATQLPLLPKSAAEATTRAESEQWSAMLTATGDVPPHQRGVSQDELAFLLDDTDEAHAAMQRALAYKQECEEVTAELAGMQQLLAEREKDLRLIKDQNAALKSKANELVEKYTSVEEQLSSVREEATSNAQELAVVQQQKSTLEQDKESLMSRVGIMDRNLQIQDQNIKTLKTLAVNLANEVETYKTKLDDLAREHKLAELRLQENYATEAARMKQEFDAQTATLRKLLDESEDSRQRSAADWREREMRLERRLHDELRTKDKEITTLRKRSEELLEQQMDKMRDMIDGVGDHPRSASGHSNTKTATAVKNTSSAVRSSKDLKSETEALFGTDERGAPILSLSLTASNTGYGGAALGHAVTWDSERNCPRHHYDPNTRSYKVRVHANPDELGLAEGGGNNNNNNDLSATLHSQMLSSSKSSVLNSSADHRHAMQWAFVTRRGAKLNVQIEMLPPE